MKVLEFPATLTHVSFISSTPTQGKPIQQKKSQVYWRSPVKDVSTSILSSTINPNRNRN